MPLRAYHRAAGSLCNKMSLIYLPSEPIENDESLMKRLAVVGAVLDPLPDAVHEGARGRFSMRDSSAVRHGAVTAVSRCRSRAAASSRSSAARYTR